VKTGQWCRTGLVYVRSTGKSKEKNTSFQLVCIKREKYGTDKEKAVDSMARFLYFAASLLDGWLTR
jgi:hypothetical protein